ncbi:MAG: GLPGLI family protein [Ferruginibacter sp.]
MKNIIIILILFFGKQASAQVFIDKGVIEFEVKTNIKKTMGNSSWAEMMKDKLPQFKTAFYELTFGDNKSTYKLKSWENKSSIPEYLRKSDEENFWFMDYTNHKLSMVKNIFGTALNIEDSIPVIKWKLTNESRIIAGFNCRKAVGVMMDSVYVFAFYTDEITVSGGPCSLSGLPGMILGVTIPRMYSSWIATKLNVNGVNEKEIKSISGKKTMPFATLKGIIMERLKDWGGSDEDSKAWMNQMIWSTFL